MPKAEEYRNFRDSQQPKIKYVLTGTFVTNGHELRVLAHSLMVPKPPSSHVPNTTRRKLMDVKMILATEDQIYQEFPDQSSFTAVGIDPGICNTATATIISSDDENVMQNMSVPRCSGLSKQKAFNKASTLADQLKDQKKKLVSEQQKKVTKHLQSQTAASENLRKNPSDVAYEELRKVWQIFRTYRDVLFPLKESLRGLRKEWYYWNKVHKAAPKEGEYEDDDGGTVSGMKPQLQQRDTIPTWELPAVEDKVDKIDITFAGTDYGLCRINPESTDASNETLGILENVKLLKSNRTS
ncbi:hypothetical protein BGZ58_010841 [Dissophora ornata]|nr:hypothetical protein BGZ58_010841 [Dissophora ornata]